MHPIEAELRRIADGGDAEGLRVAYSDVHGLWGGVAITLTGAGEYEQAPYDRAGALAPIRRRVGAEQVAAMARLLVEIEAWEQRVPERMPVPDESRASLVVEVGGGRAAIWEWYNDLERNGRIARVRDALLALGEGAA